MKSLALYVCLALILLLAPTAMLAGAVTITPCSCGDDAPGIQLAISQATHNGTVGGTVTFNGTFSLAQSVNIAVPNLTLQAGTGGAEVDAPDLTAFFILQGGDGLIFNGLSVIGRRGVVLNDLVNAVNNVTISNNRFSTLRRGVVQFSGDALATGWIIRNNLFTLIDPSACPPDSLCAAVLVAGNKGVIEDNVVQYGPGNTLGISVQNNHGFGGATHDGGIGWSVQGNTVDADIAFGLNGASSTQLSQNRTVTAGSYGITATASNPAEAFIGLVVPGETNKISGNEISNKSVAGIVIGAAANTNSVVQNSISALGSGAAGISIGDDLVQVPGVTPGPSHDNQVHGNKIDAGGIGILLRAASEDNVITGNSISGATVGIQQEAAAGANLVRGNPGADPVGGGPNVKLASVGGALAP